MNIELENNSASTLEKFLQKRDIQTVVFDVDNTLLATHQYYRDTLYCIGMDVAEYLNVDRPSEVIAEDLTETFFNAYRRENHRPRLIQEQCLEAFEEYFGIEASEEIQKMLKTSLENFYLQSPTPYGSTELVLKEFLKCGVNIALHSHAQEGWTNIKAKDLEEALGYSIPYLATDITERKDRKSWSNAFEMTDTNPSNILVVGDSLDSDILPAIEAGCKSLIWINRYNTGIPEDICIPKDVELVVVNKIGDILIL